MILSDEDFAARVAAGRATYVTTATRGPEENRWLRIPGSDSGELHKPQGILSAYVRPLGRAEIDPSMPYWQVFVWRVWSHGSVLAEGISETEGGAMADANIALDNVAWSIRDAIKALDIRNRKGA